VKTQIKIDGRWLDGIPQEGEWYRQQVSTLQNGDPLWQEQRKVTTGEIPPTKIEVTNILGADITNSSFTRCTCKELTNITVSGNLNTPDRLFSLPIRRDDGRLFLFPAQVTSGTFEVIINFPTTGQFTYSDKEANVDLPYQMFTVDTIKFDVLRNTQ